MKKTIAMLRNSGLVLVSGAMMLMPRLALAAPGDPITNLPPGPPLTLTRIGGILDIVSDFLIFWGVVVAVIFIIWGGITYMAAGGDPEAATKAKTRIWNGVIGAIVVLGIGLIIRTIQALLAGSVIG